MKKNVKIAIIFNICFISAWIQCIQAKNLDCQTHMKKGFSLHASHYKPDNTTNQKKLQQIQFHYESAINVCPNICEEQPELCNNLGMIYHQKGQLKQSAQLFKKALANKPNLESSLFGLARVYEDQQLDALALDYYMKVLDNNPDDKEARTRAYHIFTEKNCQNCAAEKGELVQSEQLYNTLACKRIFEKAKKRFNLTRSIVVVPTYTFRNINFQLGSARLTNESMPQLIDMFKMLNQYQELNINIDGHTDKLAVKRKLEVLPGHFCYSNQCLSEKRAFSVKQFLMNKGISDHRLNIKGYADTKSISDDLAKNRRVEIRDAGY